MQPSVAAVKMRPFTYSAAVKDLPAAATVSIPSPHLVTEIVPNGFRVKLHLRVGGAAEIAAGEAEHPAGVVLALPTIGELIDCDIVCIVCYHHQAGFADEGAGQVDGGGVRWPFSVASGRALP